MEIKTDTRNDIFKRNEIMAVVEAEKNPTFDEAKKMMVEKTGKPEEAIDVYGVKGRFGSNQFKIEGYVYDSKEDLEKAIQKTQKQRKEEAEAKKSAENEAPAEEKKEETKKAEAEKPAEAEAPAEDKKEEKGVAPEDKPEQAEEKSEEKPVEASPEEEASSGSTAPEDKPEEEAKAVEEEKEKKEESKE